MKGTLPCLTPSSHAQSSLSPRALRRLLSGILRGAGRAQSANIAIIGCGGRGGRTSAPRSENIVALCDVNQRAIDAAAKNYPKARQTTDFRTLFDHHASSTPSSSSTCEHTPRLRPRCSRCGTTTRLLRESRSRTGIWEARRSARRRPDQGCHADGHPIHATENYRRVVELVQSGAIGAVREAHVWVSRAWAGAESEDAKRFGDIVTPQRTAEGSDTPVPTGLKPGTCGRPGAGAAVSTRPSPRPEMVSLVGFRQRYHERPRQPLDSICVLGACGCVHRQRSKPAGRRPHRGTLRRRR